MEALHSAPARLSGVLIFWHLSKSGGFGKILVYDRKTLFFLHRQLIESGVPIPGSIVSFIPIPASPGKVLPQASAAAIDNSKIIRALEVTSKVGA
jgi:hypothetical protein